jgi:hypothetical protein
VEISRLGVGSDPPSAASSLASAYPLVAFVGSWALVSTTTTATINGDKACDLVRAARNGDPRASEQLIDRYTSVVWPTVRSFRLREADVHDAVQNTWLRMIEHLG